MGAQGRPLRFEIGPRDVDNNSVFCAKRTGDKKFGITVDENFESEVDACSRAFSSSSWTRPSHDKQRRSIVSTATTR